MKMYLIFRLLLNILHFFYNIFKFCRKQYVTFTFAIKYHFGYRYQLENRNIYLSKANKIPRHLAILIGKEKLTTINFAKLITWCITSEIPFVSFYDHKGFLKKNQDFFKHNLERSEPFVTQNIEWSNEPGYDDIKLLNKTVKFNVDRTYLSSTHLHLTDTIKDSKTKIHILSYMDSKEKIVMLTKSLARLMDLNFLNEERIMDLLDEKLNIDFRIPDPDLAIVFGETMCTYGFLPWQTRITEFFNIPLYENIRCEDFMNTLNQFSQCHQRYGK